MLWRDVLPGVLHGACRWIVRPGCIKDVRRSPGAYQDLFIFPKNQSWLMRFEETGQLHFLTFSCDRRPRLRSSGGGRLR